MSNPKGLRLLLVSLVALLALAAAAGAAGSPPAYTGSLVGTSTINGTLILHADGSASYHDTEVFTGTVNGVAGTLTFNLNGVNDSELAVHATATIVGATGVW